MELDASSVESSEDWENSVNSSELDVQYQSDEERADNEVSLKSSSFLSGHVAFHVLLLLSAKLFFTWPE